MAATGGEGFRGAFSLRTTQQCHRRKLTEKPSGRSQNGVDWFGSGVRARPRKCRLCNRETNLPFPPPGEGGEPRGSRRTESPRRCAPSAGLRIPRRGPQDSARLERTPTLAPPSPERPTLRRPRPRPAPAPPGDLGLRPPGCPTWRGDPGLPALPLVLPCVRRAPGRVGVGWRPGCPRSPQPAPRSAPRRSQPPIPAASGGAGRPGRSRGRAGGTEARSRRDLAAV